MAAATSPTSRALLERLDRDNPKGESWAMHVIAAVEGDEALEQLLAADVAPSIPAAPKAPKARKSGVPPATATLRSVTVEGFRGIGRSATLEFPPGVGLTLVVGRNGSGKSSFAEAVELLLTGDTFRWKKKSKVWKDGWRNLHYGHAAIQAEFIVEGEKTLTTVKRRWEDAAPLDSAETSAQVHGKTRTSLDALGWTQPLLTHRPFLSYEELGSMLEEGPSKLYDALASILGLDDLVAAQDRLVEARKKHDGAWKTAAQMRTQMLKALPALDDERARALSLVLTREDWGLDEAERIVTAQDAGGASDRDLLTLRALATVAVPDAVQVESVVAALRSAGAALALTRDTLAGRSNDLANVLQHALDFHARYGDGACPVCDRKGALTAAWHDRHAAQVTVLRDTAREATSAQAAAAAAVQAARRLPVPRAELLEQAAALGLDGTAAVEASARWQQALAQTEPGALAAALEEAAASLLAAVAALRLRAEAEARRREDLWRPLSLQIAAWLPDARTALGGRDAIAPLKKAESWLKGAIDDLRTEQFAPIKEKCQTVWNQLRQQSNVALDDVVLSGTATKRKVDLSVSVDGVPGAALGVMSQGELHALALSLFIPRATLPGSPFRFLVIDDPVQSMDPARVDGLARVLEDAATTRQVIVFTHDDRLPEAVRRMGIPARVLEVTRRAESVVEVVKGRDPVARHIEDAMAIAKTEGVPPAAVKRVIPGLCRLAFEAASTEVIRRRRLGKGERNDEVEALLLSCSGTKALVTLALFDDPQRTADVMPRLAKEAREFADVFRICNEGAHGVDVSMRVDLVRQAEKLARWLQTRG